EEKGLIKGKLEGREEGKLEGREEGKLEGKLEVAQQMLASGMDRHTVMKLTGLSDDDLRNLRH
ncbi:TPA: ISNCY family transposase, partial [Salmonella enterica]|nr:ISNCY family transposase [Salmonella enterica]